MRYAVLMLLVLGLAVQYAEACGSPPPPVVPEAPIFIMTPDSVNEGSTAEAVPGGNMVPTVSSNTDYDGSSDPLADASAPEPMLDENGNYVYDDHNNLLDVYGNVITAPTTIVTTGEGGSQTLDVWDFSGSSSTPPAGAFKFLPL